MAELYTKTSSGVERIDVSVPKIEERVTNLETKAVEVDKYKLDSREQTLTTEQKAQVVQNLVGTFLPLTGGDISGRIGFKFGNIFSNTDNELSELIIGSDTNGTSEDGSFISLRNASSTIAPGSVAIYTRYDDGRTGNSLILPRDGGLIVGNYSADLINSSGANWIRYELGVQIVWGSATRQNSGQMTYTFPAPFSSWEGDAYNASYSITTTPYAYAGVWFENQVTVTLKPESIIINTNRTIGVRFMAIGRWK